MKLRYLNFLSSITLGLAVGAGSVLLLFPGIRHGAIDSDAEAAQAKAPPVPPQERPELPEVECRGLRMAFKEGMRGDGWRVVVCEGESFETTCIVQADRFDCDWTRRESGAPEFEEEAG